MFKTIQLFVSSIYLIEGLQELFNFVKLSVFTVACNIRPTIPTKAICLSTKERSVARPACTCQPRYLCDPRRFDTLLFIYPWKVASKVICERNGAARSYTKGIEVGLSYTKTFKVIIVRYYIEGWLLFPSRYQTMIRRAVITELTTEGNECFPEAVFRITTFKHVFSLLFVFLLFLSYLSIQVIYFVKSECVSKLCKEWKDKIMITLICIDMI